MFLLIASVVLSSSSAVQEHSLAEAIETHARGRSYDVVWNSGIAIDHAGWGADHPKLDLRARFEDGAIEIERASGATWRWNLRLSKVERAQRSLAFDEGGALSIDRDVVTLAHGSADEQFLHCERGWEHTVRIAARPAGAGALEVHFALATDLEPLLDGDERGVAFFDGCGNVALDYRGLAVWDASGTKLPARFELASGALCVEIDDSDALYPLLIDPVISTSETKLVTSTGATNSAAGSVVAIDGDTAVVREAFNTFSVRWVVFERGAGGWLETAAIVNAGVNADLDGDWLLLGDGYYGWTGEAWLYHRVGTTWTYTPGLECPVPSYSCEPQTFGICLDIDGDTAVVGETERNCPWSQSVYIGEFNPTTQHWRYQSRIPTGAIALALDGDDLILVGYTSVRYYHRNGFGNPFAYVSTLVSNSTYWTYRGVGLDDGVAVVRYGSGDKAEIYELHGTQFVLVATAVLSPGSLIGSNYAMPIVDGLVAIGDRLSDVAATDAGAVQLWSRNGGWSLAATVTASDAAASDAFGHGLDLDRRAPARAPRLIAGAYGDDAAGAGNRGAAYVLDLAHQGALVYCTSKINSQNCIPRVAFSGAASVSSSTPFTISCANVINQRNGVFFYGTSGRQVTPFQGAFRCVANPTRRTGQLFSGGNTGTTDCSGSFALDFNAHIQSGVDPNLVAGAVVDGQFWYRDGAASFGTGLSEAVEFEIVP